MSNPDGGSGEASRFGLQSGVAGGSAPGADPEAERSARFGARPAAERSARFGAGPAAERSARFGAGPAVERSAHFGAGPAVERNAHFGADPAAERSARFGAGPAAERGVRFGAGPAVERSARFGAGPAAERSAHFGAGPAAERSARFEAGPAVERSAGFGVETGGEEAREVVAHVARRTFTPLDPVARDRPSDIVARTVKYIATHFAEEITLDDLARGVQLSKFHFLRRFRKEVGMTPGAFLKRYRIVQAMERLTTTRRPIREVGRMVGYKDATAFSRAFIHFTGTQPYLFRETRQAKVAEDQGRYSP